MSEGNAGPRSLHMTNCSPLWEVPSIVVCIENFSSYISLFCPSNKTTHCKWAVQGTGCKRLQSLKYKHSAHHVLKRCAIAFMTRADCLALERRHTLLWAMGYILLLPYGKVFLTSMIAVVVVHCRKPVIKTLLLTILMLRLILDNITQRAVFLCFTSQGSKITSSRASFMHFKNSLFSGLVWIGKDSDRYKSSKITTTRIR